MIVLAVAGTVLLFVLAVVVGIVDAAHAPRWRQVAADRRRAWESGRFRNDDYPTGPQPLPGRR